jgi:hypothetical protein
MISQLLAAFDPKNDDLSPTPYHRLPLKKDR